MEGNKTQSYAIPVAIIVGFALIAVAIFFSGRGNSQAPVAIDTGAENSEQAPQGSLEAINPVSGEDHIRGNPNAPIMLVEYSDYDCPYCRIFHDTLNQVMEEYGEDGRVAWVFRQFPLEQLHPNAPLIAQTSECVAKLGGNDAFWKFNDELNASRDITYDAEGQLTGIEPTDMTKLPNFVASAGVDQDALDACIASGETRALVEEDFNNAIAIGGRGTPHTIVIVGDQQGVINGAQPYSVVKGIIDNLINQIDGGNVAQ